MTELADRLDEAGELLNRYNGSIPDTWQRNLDTLCTLLAVQSMWQVGRIDSVDDWMKELDVFLSSAFLMGAESVS